MKKTNIPLVEKYRPLVIEDIVLDDVNKTIFDNIIKTRHFPHLILYGPPGIGKTTSIINLINTFQENKDSSSIIHLNASDDRGIEIIRNQLNSFVISNSIFTNTLKFIILDEVDYMTKSAHLALKILISNAPNNICFCLICNYISKIDISIIDNFMCIQYNKLPVNKIINFLENICIKENFQFDKEQLIDIQKKYGYDIRSMINFIQNNNNNSKKYLIESSTIYNKIYKSIISNNTKEIINYFHNLHIDVKSLLYNFLIYLVVVKKKINTYFLDTIEEILNIPNFNKSYMLEYFFIKISNKKNDL
jgi:replication factor C subunit 3/5